LLGVRFRVIWMMDGQLRSIAWQQMERGMCVLCYTGRLGERHGQWGIAAL